MTTLREYIGQSVAEQPELGDLIREADAELELGLQLAAIREQCGLTQREVGRRAGMPQSAVARYEKAGRTPTATALWKLAHALNAAIILSPEYGVRVIHRGPGVSAPMLPMPTLSPAFDAPVNPVSDELTTTVEGWSPVGKIRRSAPLHVQVGASEVA